MNQDSILQEIIKHINSLSKPKTIFIYGSRARGDYNEKNSDFEIGVIFDENEYISRKILNHNFDNSSNVRIFPFKLQQILDNTLDTPFNKNIYLNEVILGGKIIYGDDVLSSIQVPEITKLDLISTTEFNLGMALSVVLINREGNSKLAKELFSKTCLMSVRALLLNIGFKLPISYKDISDNAFKVVKSDEYLKLINKAYQIRKNIDSVDDEDFYKNISFINQYVIPFLKK